MHPLPDIYVIGCVWNAEVHCWKGITQHCWLLWPATRPALLTFKTLNKKITPKPKQNCTSQNIDREVFSNLIVIAQKREIDIPAVLSYELAPVPLSVFNLDGIMHKRTKSSALSWAEKCPSLQALPETQAPSFYVVDFMMLLRMVCTDTSKCQILGNLSETLLSTILPNSAPCIAVEGDVYSNSNSIKSGERAQRGLVQMQEIHNPSHQTPLPKQRQKMLSNPKNKTNLTQFIMVDWTTKAKTLLNEDQILYLAGGFKEPHYVIGVTKTTEFLS